MARVLPVVTANAFEVLLTVVLKVAETESSEPETGETFDDGADTQTNDVDQAEPADTEQAQ